LSQSPSERSRIARMAAEARWFRWSEIKRVSRAAAKSSKRKAPRIKPERDHRAELRVEPRA
jgi:hypothetical protein